MKRLIWSILSIALLGTTLSLAAAGSDPSGFERMLVHYEAIRMALLNDATTGIAEQADWLVAEANATSGGEASGDAAELLTLLPSIGDAAGRLAQAPGIDEMRDAFGELSKLMVRYRQMTVEPAPVVVFCSMVQKVWLQPEGEIGNPYYGQSMSGCGEIVSE